MKIALFTAPHLGGTWTCCKITHEGLALHNIDTIRINYGSKAIESNNDIVYENEQNWGVIVSNSDNEQTQARAVADYLISNDFDGVIVDIFSNNVSTNLLRYLPDHIFRIVFMHTISTATIGALVKFAPYSHAFVGISPAVMRCYQNHNIIGNHVKLIPNSIACDSLPTPHKLDNDCLKVIFLGRLEEQTKRIFDLPKIMKLVNKSITLDIYGDGDSDKDKLLDKIKGYPNIKYCGFVQQENLFNVISQYDAMIITSRTESFCRSLIEGMAGGCVPICTCLHGVTDEIVEHGKTGYLFKVGDCKTAAKYLNYLANNPKNLVRMQKESQAQIQKKYTRGMYAKSLATLLEEVKESPRKIAAPLDIANWELPLCLRGGLIRRFIPANIRTFLGTLKNRWYFR